MSSVLETPLNGIGVRSAAAAPASSAPDYRPLPRVSVVVPTYRRPKLLRRCLDALLAQTLEPGAFEVIVVDDGRSDATRRVVEDLAQQQPAAQLVYLEPETGRGPAVARNCGWRAARAELVAFTDDDTIPAPDWLEQGTQAMQLFPWVALGGQVKVPRTETEQRAPTDHELMTIGIEDAEFVTANAFVRHRALVQVRGFDERFKRAWREDADLQIRLQNKVGPVGRCEQAVVLHPVRPERWGVSLRQQKNVFYDALLYRKHRRFYRKHVRSEPPWDYYAIVALTLGALVAGLGDLAVVAAPCLALVSLLVLRFAARRLEGTSRAPAHVFEMLATSALIPFLSVYWRLRGAWHFRTWFL